MYLFVVYLIHRKGVIKVDYRILKSKITLHGLNVAELTKKLNENGLDIAVSTMYLKLRGGSEFDRAEIKAIKEVLQLTDAEVMDIFFDGEETR